jgi:serine/threonine-protein kinase
MGEAEKAQGSADIVRLPRMMGRWLLLKRLARGGMGDVYLAASTGIEGAERPCIVKTVRRDQSSDKSMVIRFLDEFRVQAQLNHPGVAQVMEAVVGDEGEPYAVVEFVEGRSISEAQHRAHQLGFKIAWPEAVAIVLEMAQALDHVHTRQGLDGSALRIVHRDLSPQNCMVGFSGEVKVIDFGTARGTNRRCRTVGGVVYAKPGYIAPEVSRGEVGDGRVDLYALGIMLWELACGRSFLGSDPHRHLQLVAEGRMPVPPIAAACSAPEVLDEIIAKLTANKPEHRYGTSALAVSDLAKLMAMAPPAPDGVRGTRPRIGRLLRNLWPTEPDRTRAEFARLLRGAKERLTVNTPLRDANAVTPSRNQAAQVIDVLRGTPYRLMKLVASSEEAEVHEAEHAELGRRSILKVLPSSLAASPAALERFRNEAKALARLSHPNIVALHEVGTAGDGRPYIAMERVVGETLSGRLRREGALATDEALGVAKQLLRGLQAAHREGVLHLDLKPDNVMLAKDGSVRIVDFGMSSAVRDAGGLTPSRSGKDAVTVNGTPEYMAPEQVIGSRVDARTDVYAVGCILFEALTGHPVFERSARIAQLGKHLHDAPISLRARAPERHFSPAVQAIVEKALQKSPSERFASAQQFLDAIDEAERIPARQRTMRSRAAMTVGAFFAVGLGLLAGKGMNAAAPAAPLAIAEPMATTGAPFVAPAAPAPVARPLAAPTAQLKAPAPRR